jgi:hypothetical protein
MKGDTARSASLAGYIRPILTGLLILAAGLLPWMWLAQLNAPVRPDLPWAALVTVGYLGISLAWLNGWAPPSRTASQRPRRLRLWPPSAPDAEGLATGVVVVLYGTLARRTRTILPGMLIHVWVISRASTSACFGEMGACSS